jgi:outer membrane protein
MKKTVLAAAFSLALAPSIASADMLLGLYAGAQGWNTSTSGSFSDNSSNTDSFNFDTKANTALYVAFEHPIPLIPNIKLNRTTLNSDGDTNLSSSFTFDGSTYSASSDIYTESDIDTTDIILYYEIFDNDLVSFDLGINAKYIDGELYVKDTTSGDDGNASFKGVIPMLYSRAQVGLPFTGLGVYAEGSYLSFDDHKVSDYQVALTYAFVENLAIDMTLQLGYRSVDIDIEDLDDVYADLSYDGVFAGLEVHF